MGYTDRLREYKLISDQFLINVFHILDLYGGRGKAFKLDLWAVDEYHLDSEQYTIRVLLILTFRNISVLSRVIPQSPATRSTFILPCTLSRPFVDPKLDPGL